MKNLAQKYLDWYLSQDKLVRVLFCILWDIPSNLYRFAKSAQKDSVLGMAIAIILMIFGGWVLFVVDIVCVAFKDKVYWFEELGFDESDDIFKDNSDSGNSQNNDSDARDGVVE